MDPFQFSAPLPKIDMRAVSWAIANNMDYATPIFNEWSALKLDGFPQQPEYLPFDQAWYDGWMGGHEAAMVDPLDEFSLYMLLHQAEPHCVEDDLVQEEPRVLGDHISTFNSAFSSVCDGDHDPCSYITNGGSARPQVPYPSNRDCSIMVTDLVPPANFWDVDEVVDIQVGTEVGQLTAP
ncbi:hypothetical protein RHMOL_Rhmol08G0170700 [Rhododendron molle]|uniref:Uncharacterized protein n=1 Tax=Rhododendron molle TaxID=49168 RepID=A0ACC0MP58_RHOML|nr:hypothetical protein RHMOL_Rhmol08G0170700 [Rhododendron molle]